MYSLKYSFLSENKKDKIIKARGRLIKKINEFSRFENPIEATRSLNQALRIYDIICPYVDTNGRLYRQMDKAILNYCYKNLFLK